MSVATDFLKDFQGRPLTTFKGARLKSEKYIIGQGQASQLEVLVLSSQNDPQKNDILKVQKKRKNNRASPVLLTVIHGDNKADLCGVSEFPPVYKNIKFKMAEDFCRTALTKPDRHQVIKFCHNFLPSIENGLFGLNNKGMFSQHNLTQGVKKRDDWLKACEKSKNLISLKKEKLLKGLGFHIEPLDNLSSILKSQDKKRAIAVFLKPLENHESAEQRFNQQSPIRYALDKAEQENMPWVVIVQDNHIRLYSTDQKPGVKDGGRSDTYIECQTSLLSQDDLGYLWLIFSAEALSEDGSLYEILKESKRFSANVATDLKKRIYDQIIPQIAKGIIVAKNLKKPSAQDLEQSYHSALTILFRLLFIAHAEDKDLLPYNTNEAYRNRSLKQKAQELSNFLTKREEPDEGDNHWQDTVSLWKAIDKGKKEWGIMAYNGGLFSSEKEISKIGFDISKISISNKFFVPALKNLLLMKTKEQDLASVDFRFMGPKEFGTVYEGLLESSLSQADTDLTLGKKDVYIPLKNITKTKSKQDIKIKKGEIYLHNQSGARKASGSYYTKQFAVDHILDKSLEPALQKHFKRLDKLSDTEAGKEFFNFMVADISMGSGHFLVTAVDRIEKAMANYLNKRPLKLVKETLQKIKSTAKESLKNLSDDYFSVEDRSYLARHVAKHCVYGVDKNNLAVELAKLSLWSHTFIPGLPLSYFNHNLICADSLIGIGTIEEIQSVFKKHKESQQQSLDFIDKEILLGQAKKPLLQMKNLSDLNLKEVEKNRTIKKQIQESLKDTKALFDVLLFNRIQDKGNIDKIEALILKWIKNPKSIHKSQSAKKAKEMLKGLQVLHFPLAFPEVFLRERPGFDVIIGNPPWEKITLEEHAFWARYFPGLRGLSQREREKEYQKVKTHNLGLVKEYQEELDNVTNCKNILKQVSFPQNEAGNPDLYKYFCWRFWNLICEGDGCLGVVLPGNVFSAKGSELFRKEIFNKAVSHITLFFNNKKWIFPEVHAQYPITLISLKKPFWFNKYNNTTSENKKRIHIQGPFYSFEEFIYGKDKKPLSFTEEQILSWTDSASLPSLPNKNSLEVFLQLRKAPRLDNAQKSWKVRPNIEMQATGQKSLMDLKSEKCPKDFWPVFTGKSFNIWEPDTGQYYAYANPEKVIDWLYNKREQSYRNKKGVFSDFAPDKVKDRKTLPCFKPRIAFHDVTNSIDYRTIKASLIPKAFLVHQAPYLLFSKGDEKDSAFVLAVLSSFPLDWYARRFVKTHLSFYLLNTFPIPRPSRTNPLWQRVVALSGRLASPDQRFAEWTRAVGVEYGPLDEEKKQDMIHELDALVAHLYGLSEKQLIHIFETFHKNPEYYASRKIAVLKYYRSWKKRHISA